VVQQAVGFVYECFDRIVIHGYLSGLSRPEQAVYFVRQILGIPVVTKRCSVNGPASTRRWVEAYNVEDGGAHDRVLDLGPPFEQRMDAFGLQVFGEGCRLAILVRQREQSHKEHIEIRG
jgi:hypothetical protein